VSATAPSAVAPRRIELGPGKDFAGIIEKFWLTPPTPGDGRWIFEILPDGSFDLLFVLSENGCRIIYTGPYTKLRRVPLRLRDEHVCVRFRPGRMPPVADVAASDLVDSSLTLPDVLGASADELGEKLLGARGLDAKSRVLEALFRRSGLGSSLSDGRFLRCAAAVDAAHGVVRVRDVARQAGVSVRTLERAFHENVGLRPKTFIRNVRFQHVLARLDSPGSITSLAALASDCGYFDQSHLIKDFRALAGRLPGAS
jgi:AraC-like DNA-binding protein